MKSEIRTEYYKGNSEADFQKFENPHHCLKWLFSAPVLQITQLPYYSNLKLSINLTGNIFLTI